MEKEMVESPAEKIGKGKAKAKASASSATIAMNGTTLPRSAHMQKYGRWKNWTTKCTNLKKKEKKQHG